MRSWTRLNSAKSLKRGRPKERTASKGREGRPVAASICSPSGGLFKFWQCEAASFLLLKRC